LQGADGRRNGMAAAMGIQYPVVHADLDFEDLFARLSASLVAATSEHIDDEINRWLRTIGVAFRIDRLAIGLLNPDTRALIVAYQWVHEGIRGNPIGLNVSETYPWLGSKVMAGEAVIASSDQELPPESSTDLERAPGFGSTVTVPLRIDGVIEGGMAFASVARKRFWSPRTVKRMRLIADAFGSALRRKRITAQNRRLAEEMRKVSRVVMMGELTAALAHELNQPLGAILNNSRAAQRLLAARTPDLKEVGAALGDIVRDNARAVEIIRNVRSIFQPGQARMSPLDLKQVLEDVRRMVAADAKMKNISLSLELPESLPPTVGDRSQLVEALLNLVLNAFDAVCEGSEGPREVALRAGRREPGHVHVAVRDSGRGIDPAAMPRLFQMFFTTKPSGMGIGLAIARSIIEKHGGKLWAAQNPGRGATLEFILPVSGAPGSSASEVRP
jgi:signal transduction histidine kinase